MCGIAGILNLERANPVNVEIVKRMVDVIRYRGPDDEGFYVQKNVVLGMCRLSIIDIEKGHQPIFNEDKKVCIVFNGEIYNYGELRQDLERRGHRFASNTDTEVIIHQYEEDGEDCVRKFNGMFSFAIWDEKKQELFLARDRMGIKPLYYTLCKGSFVFASEVKSILQVPWVEANIDFQAFHDYLSFRYVPAPRSMFSGIKKLLPGHTLTIGSERIKEQKYWEVSLKIETEMTEEECVERFEFLFKDAIKKRLISDVPLGVLLSGGLDSSSVTAMMSELDVNKIKTFSVGFDEGGDYSELNYSRIVAQKFSTDHHEVTIDYKKFIDTLPHFIWLMDEPVADLASIPLFHVAQLARKSVTVVLSGEGSDEILAGYPGFKRMIRNLDYTRKYQKLPSSVRDIIQSISRKMPESIQKKVDLLKLPLSLYGRTRLCNMTNIFSEDEKKNYLNVFDDQIRDSREHLVSLYDSVIAQDPLNQVLFVYLKSWLPDDLLIKADRMTMANSIELRVPFLDYRLVELAFSLPNEMKVRKDAKGIYISKYVLNRIMQKRLPQRIIQRKKLGFPVPAYGWLEDEMKDFSQDVLLSRQSFLLDYFRKEKVEKLLLNAREGNFTSQHKIWSFMILEMWLKANQKKQHPEFR